VRNTEYMLERRYKNTGQNIAGVFRSIKYRQVYAGLYGARMRVRAASAPWSRWSTPCARRNQHVLTPIGWKPLLVARRDPSALASVAEGLPFAESAFAECTVVLSVLALLAENLTVVIATARHPIRLMNVRYLAAPAEAR
jgi:hypothetical protein